MPITKNDLNNLQKSLISEISKFLEDHVINKLFKLGKDVGGDKTWSGTLENHEEKITFLEQPKFT